MHRTSATIALGRRARTSKMDQTRSLLARHRRHSRPAQSPGTGPVCRQPAVAAPSASKNSSSRTCPVRQANQRSSPPRKVANSAVVVASHPHHQTTEGTPEGNRPTKPLHRRDKQLCIRASHFQTSVTLTGSEQEACRPRRIATRR